MIDMRYLMVGAGPTGLGAAWALDAAGHTDWLLVEAQPSAGGLAGSCVDAHGFTWDFGGHVQFSHYDYFDQLMDQLLGADGWLLHEREAWVWMQERFIPYPVQHNLHGLPEPLASHCLHDLMDTVNHGAGAPANFGQWLEQQFGSALMQAFMRPYNDKVWAWPLEEMNAHWVGERVATVDRKRLAENFAARRNDVGWGPNNRFRFPARGGTGAIWQALAALLRRRHGGRMRFSTQLKSIDVVRRLAHLSDGTTVRYNALLSSLPVDELVRLGEFPASLTHSTQKLEHSSTHVVGIGLKGQPPERLRRKCWMYFPDANLPFYRVTVFSNYAPANVPRPGEQWSLMTEVAESSHRPLPSGNLEQRVVNALLDSGLIEDPAQVHHLWHRRLPHGYPIPTTGRDAALATLLPGLESLDIFSRGRFGAWKYEVSNQDHCFAQGVELVHRWLEGRPETTLQLA
jgi:protoporphyrinogen oxidase